MAEKPDKNSLLLEKQAKEEKRQAKIAAEYAKDEISAIKTLGQKQDRLSSIA